MTPIDYRPLATATVFLFGIPEQPCGAALDPGMARCDNPVVPSATASAVACLALSHRRLRRGGARPAARQPGQLAHSIRRRSRRRSRASSARSAGSSRCSSTAAPVTSSTAISASRWPSRRTHRRSRSCTWTSIPEEEALVLASPRPARGDGRRPTTRSSGRCSRTSRSTPRRSRRCSPASRHRRPKAGLTDPDDIPAPPDEATTQPGDLWLLGDHRLLCGDAGSAADLDRLLDGTTVALLATDPPYNVKVEPRSNNAIAAGLSLASGHRADPPPGARPRPAPARRRRRPTGSCGPRTGR